MVLGETEILGQLKAAYDLALKHGHTGARLNKAFQRAFHTAKHVRTHTAIQRGSVSVASVAVELAEKIFNSLGDREVLVIGAGDTSEKAARALLSRGAKNIIVASRTLDRAQALAGELGGRAVPFDDWAGEFEKIDIAISSTAAPHHILDRATLEPLMKQRKNRPLLLIDIAVPRDIDPEVNFLENVYLYNIDDLQTIADDSLRLRQEEIARCEKIIAEKVEPCLKQKSFSHGWTQMNTDIKLLPGDLKPAIKFSFHPCLSVFICGSKMAAEKPIIICTRGSALALAQANMIAAQCRAAFPRLRFELKIIKTTGDKLQKASMAKTDASLPKGLFTKELEVALVKGQADLAVHSLKDLPTDLPAGLVLAATPKRADVRDVLIYRSADYIARPGKSFEGGLVAGAGRVARFQAARDAEGFSERRDDCHQQHAAQGAIARRAAGFERGRDSRQCLHADAKGGRPRRTGRHRAGARRHLAAEFFHPSPTARSAGDAVPDGLLATVLDLDVMLPCVGQGAIGIEIRADDGRIAKIVERLNHFNTFQAVTAERAFLRGMGGGCQSPVAAYAEMSGDKILLRAVSFRDPTMVKRGEGKTPGQGGGDFGRRNGGAVEIAPGNFRFTISIYAPVLTAIILPNRKS